MGFPSVITFVFARAKTKVMALGNPTGEFRCRVVHSYLLRCLWLLGRKPGPNSEGTPLPSLSHPAPPSISPLSDLSPLFRHFLSILSSLIPLFATPSIPSSTFSSCKVAPTKPTMGSVNSSSWVWGEAPAKIELIR